MKQIVEHQGGFIAAIKAIILQIGMQYVQSGESDFTLLVLTQSAVPLSLHTLNMQKNKNICMYSSISGDDLRRFRQFSVAQPGFLCPNYYR